MKTITRSNFTTVKTEGALLPPDLLQKIADGNAAGLQPQDYHLGPNERLNEAINRAWNRLLGIWQDFRQQMESLPASDNGFILTRRRWLEILFQELGYGRLHFQRSFDLPSIAGSEDQTSQQYPINYRWEHVPILLTSFRQELDKRDPALKRSPHSLLQEFLNRSTDHQWGFVSNGLALRILRDNASLTRPAYVEFDLDAMLTGEQYADFSLLWLLCHQSRMEKGGSREEEAVSREVIEEEDGAVDVPVTALSLCWLERWSQSAVEEGTRALDALRNGVQAAIEALGQGFLRQSANRDLKAALQQGDLSTQEYYRQLLRMVYRLIFLLVAEDRALLLTPNTLPAIQDRYSRYYSVGRLRALAEARRGSPHPDLYRGLRLLFAQLRDGYAPLGLPALGSFLFSTKATPALDEADLANYDLLNALRALTFTMQGSVRRAVDYKNLGAEELGSVYESLLELHPQINIDAATLQADASQGKAFALSSAAGSERKTTGSYYTPTSLITCLLDSALEPVIADRLAHCHSDDRREEESSATTPRHMTKTRDASLRPSAQHDKRTAQEQAILAIKVVDPACGSGHFLIAAANRLALHLARVRTGDNEPSPTDRRAALREVVHHCIHGVDINPMAVELCKVALWMETLDPGRPLGFLDRNIQCGNSLLGATPALLRRGIPDEAFTPILGDNKEYVSRFKKQNKQERSGKRGFDSDAFGPWRKLGKLAEQIHYLTSVGDETVDDVRFQEEYYAEVNNSPEYRASRLWADAWCAAFVWVKREDPGRHSDDRREPVEREHSVTGHSEERSDEESRAQSSRDSSLRPSPGQAQQKAALQHDNQPTGFPFPITEQIFRTIETQPERCAAWMVTEIERLHNQYQFFHWHLAFPHIFQARQDELEENDVTGWEGGFDVVLGNPPWEVMQSENDDDSNSEADRTKEFFKTNQYRVINGRRDLYKLFIIQALNLLKNNARLGLIVPFGMFVEDNSSAVRKLFYERGSVIRLQHFQNTRKKFFPSVHASYRFVNFVYARSIEYDHEFSTVCPLPDLVGYEHWIRVQRKELSYILGTDFSTILYPNKEYYFLHQSLFERLRKISSLDFDVIAEFHATSDKHLTTEERQHSNDWRLLKNRSIHQFDYQFGGSSRFLTYQSLVDRCLIKAIDPVLWAGKNSYRLLFRDIARNDDARTLICCLAPSGYVSSYDTPMLVPNCNNDVLKQTLFYLCGILNTFIYDFLIRPFVDKHIKGYVLKRLLIPSFDLTNPICSKIAEYSWQLHQTYQNSHQQGEGDRIVLLKAEIEALVAKWIGIEKTQLDFILESFNAYRREEGRLFGEYRTKRLILEIYDAMAVAMHTGKPYQTRLDPPPADPAAAHPWDEQFLGPYQEPSTWWREVAGSAAPGSEDVTYAASTKALAQKRSESNASNTVSPTATAPAMQLGLGFSPKVWPAPSGNAQARLDRVMALATPADGAISEDDLRELTALLADPQPDVRELAGQVLRQHSSGLLISIFDDFLSEAEAPRIAVAKPEISRLLHSMVETAKEENVRRTAQALMGRAAG